MLLLIVLAPLLISAARFRNNQTYSTTASFTTSTASTSLSGSGTATRTTAADTSPLSAANFPRHGADAFKNVSVSDLKTFLALAQVTQGQLITSDDLNEIALVIRRNPSEEASICSAMPNMLYGVNPYILGCSDISNSCLFHAFNGQVNTYNFALLRPRFEQAVRASEFVSMDAEFSGLAVPNVIAELDTFDNWAERYAKIKGIIETMGMFEVGLSFFIKNSLDAYEATSWTFTIQQPADLIYTDSAVTATGMNEKKKEYIRDQGVPKADFAKLVRSISGMSKPLVVYNGTWDLAFLQHDCIKALPSSWAQFKADIHSSFPTVIDMKYWADLDKLTGSNNRDLATLSQTLDQTRELGTGFYAPALLHSAQFHQAGYDSLITGNVFMHYIESRGVSRALQLQNTIRCGGRSMYKHFSLYPSGQDGRADNSLVFKVTLRGARQQGRPSPVALGKELRALFTGCKANTGEKNNETLIRFDSKAELNQFRGTKALTDKYQLQLFSTNHF